MKLYNFLNRELEEFKPIHGGYVGMYVCGPTVYGDPHLGHARAALTFDVLYRLFLYKGLQVRYIRNVTDVGHLEDEVEESGEDKIEKMARLMRMEPMQVAHMYTLRYRRAMQEMNMKDPSIEPLASGHIIEQQDFISKLLEKDWAYKVGGSVYFDVVKFTKHFEIYGTLSGKKLEDLMAGQRELKSQDEKRSYVDFALWKEVSPQQTMHWKSPWTQRGVPGWHTECCVMSEKYLGVPFDIHGGGLDLQFPHHEAEIAQSFAIHGRVPANYWLYNNMITIDQKKMSKSLNNFITLEMFFRGEHERLSKAYTPQVIRFMLLRSHYRHLLDISDEALRGAEKGFEKLQKASELAHEILLEHKISLDENFEPQGAEPESASEALYTELLEMMENDMDTPNVIARLFVESETIKTIVPCKADKEDISHAQVFLKFFETILGLQTESQTKHESQTLRKSREGATLDGLIKKLLEIRNEARKEKNFALSDQLRDSLQELGIIIQDKANGESSWGFESEN